MSAAGKALGKEPMVPLGPQINEYGDQVWPDYFGLTKREHAAIAAMAAIQANSHDNMRQMDSKLTAAFALQCADALMDELAKDNK